MIGQISSGNSSETRISQVSECTAPFTVMRWPYITAWSRITTGVTGWVQVIVLTQLLAAGTYAHGCSEAFSTPASATATA